MSLKDWETKLSLYLSQVELLGEIPLEQTEHAALEEEICALIEKHGLGEATKRLKTEYPASFVTYLAFKAAFNDERGFWNKVAQAMGLETPSPLFAHQHHWGQTFLEIIEQHPNLRCFRGVSSYEYFTPIRLHGGIPAFSLPDFFRHILLPSVEKAPYDGMEDSEALKELLNRYTAQLFVDDVVRYFFQYGGEQAQRFFTKCRQMARLVFSGQPLPAAAELGLRPYVVLAFERFKEEQSEPTLRRRRPRLYFEPYVPTFRILLPPQPLTREQAGKRYIGRLSSAENNETYFEESRLRARRQGMDWLVDEVEWELEQPVETVQISLFAEGEEAPTITYSLRILPRSDYPLLAFDYNRNNAQCFISSSLPARILWLFYPSDVELHFEGAVRCIESLNPFPPPWEEWQSCAWDLSQVRQVRLLRDGKDICPPLAVSHAIEPKLTPNNFPPQVLAVDEKPLYAHLPQVVLPLRNSSDPRAELTGWNLRLESRYAANPVGHWQGNADQLSYQPNPEQSYALVSLAEWLGDTPVGTYHLTLEHRGRPPFELPFRVCPALEIRELQSYYLPGQDGNSSVRFTIRLPENAKLSADDETKIAQRGSGVFVVTVPAKSTSANLRVELPTAPEAVHIPLHIAIPRLRWALVLKKGMVTEWKHQAFTYPLQELLQVDLASTRPRLRVELPLLDSEKPLMHLCLVAREPEHPFQISEGRALSREFHEFDLSAFFDTLRAHSEESVFAFNLKILDSKRNLDISLPVVYLSRAVNISLCHFEALQEGRWRLHWCEERPLRNRRVYVWSAWQPWNKAAEIFIPDNVPPSDLAPENSDSWWMLDIPEEIGLPPSKYYIYFHVVAPYETYQPPAFPPSNAIPVQMIAPQERLSQINRELQQDTRRAFALHFEKLCIEHELGRQSAFQEEIQWLLSHWREANLMHLEALQRWLGQYDCAENQQAFLMHMFREETLKRLQTECHPPEFVQNYLANICAVHTIHLASVRIVLELAREPKVILYALQTLLKSDAQEAHRFFWEALTQGRFSETDAAALLKNNPDFARHILADASESPFCTRLLRALRHHLDLPEWVVKSGYYILFDGGWGKILEIENAECADHFLRKTETPILTVELLHWPAQQVKIDLSRRQMRLRDRQGVYRCGCAQFIALGGVGSEHLWEEHKRFCDKTHHISPIPAESKLQSSPVYTAQPPANPFDPRSR